MLKRIFPIIAILSALSLDAFGQCKSPQQEAIEVTQRDLARIFQYVLQQTQALESFQSNEKIVVPGERAGNFYLGISRAELEASAALKKFETKSEPEYEYFLPVGYVPERTFSPHPTQKIKFAFAPGDQTLREVFVRNPEYQTSSGIRLGSTLESVKKLMDGTAREGKGKTYWVCEGITFVFEKNALTEMIVLGMKKKSPQSN